MTTLHTIDVRIKAYSDVLDEHMTVTVPRDGGWEDRVKALEPFTVYGPSYDRRIRETLADMGRMVRAAAIALDDMMRDHRLDLARHNLETCEGWAGTRSAGDG